MVAIQFSLFASIVVGTIACLVVRGGRAHRSFWSVLLAFLPFWMVGIAGSLLLSIRGTPTVEWAVPGIAVLLIGFFCRSQAVFTLTRWLFLFVTILLCFNFLVLTRRDYTAAPGLTQGGWRAFERTFVRNEGKNLRLQFPPETVLPAGPIQRFTIHSFVSEWHTPLTRLYRITRIPSVIWYPGGPVDENADKLEIRML